MLKSPDQGAPVADLQRLVDDLAARLGRPLLLEDRLQRVVAYSEQNGPMDDIRRDSILRRQSTPEVRRWLRAAGVHEAPGPLRTPGAPHLGLLPRVCVPVRHEAALLGFLWFIDTAPAMSASEVAEVAAAAPAVALALFHESLATGLASHRELEAVTGLLMGEREAARQLIEAGAFPQGRQVTVLVARPREGEADDAVRLALEQGLLALRRRLSGHHPLHLVRYDHAALLVAGGSVPWERLGVYRMLTRAPGAELHPGLEPLLGEAQHLPLLETLETYLDLAGSAVATSRALRLHRTSLYYRLKRVEELARTDLK